MSSKEQLWRAYVDVCEIDVPEEAIQNELNYLTLHMKHSMQYDRLTGGDPHLFPARELEDQADEMRAAAMFEAKEPRVLKAIIDTIGLEVTQEELEEEATAMAARQSTTVDAIKQFFGEDLCMLKRDVLERKARDWAVSEALDS